MSERDPAIAQPDIELATAIAAGGALTTDRCRLLYDGQLGTDPNLPPEDRFFPNPLDNVRDHEEAYKRFEGFAEDRYSRGNNGRLVVIGHSFGGFLAVKLGLRRPDIVAAVKSQGGLQEGYDIETLSIRGLAHLVGDEAGVEDARHDSPHMQEFHEEIASDWSPDTSLDLHSALFDDCFPLPQGLNLKLPEGQKPGRRVVAPRIPGLMRLLRRIDGMPEDVELLPTRFVTEHILLPGASGEINHTLGLRAAVAAGRDPQRIREVAPVRDLQPALAAA